MAQIITWAITKAYWSRRLPNVVQANNGSAIDTQKNDQWLRPDQVTRMTDEQAATTDVSSRLEWIKFSLSSAPVIPRDITLTAALGINIDAARLLPDIILVDLGPKDPLFVFVEVVATDGPINETRREAFLELVVKAGYAVSQATFVTAYFDRDEPAFKKTLPVLAWRTFAWTLSEPDKIILMSTPHTDTKLSNLLSSLS